MNSIITYSLDDFKQISENFDAELDDEVVKTLIEIKKNNRFSKRKTPLRLKYTLANTWRLIDNKNSDLTREEILCKLVTSNLNKLSNDNFDIILNLIKEQIDSYSDVSYEVVIDIIFEKSLEENFYCDSYSKLIFNLVYQEELKKEYLIKKCDIFYKNFLEEKIDESLLKSDDYDIVCSINEKKSNILSGFTMISLLFNLNLFKYEYIKEIFTEIVTKLDKSESNYLGIYIDVIIVLLENSNDTIQKNNIEDYNNLFIKTIDKNISDKDRILPKYRFRMKDLLDKIVSKS